jgi:hypothetical protein
MDLDLNESLGVYMHGSITIYFETTHLLLIQAYLPTSSTWEVVLFCYCQPTEVQQCQNPELAMSLFQSRISRLDGVATSYFPQGVSDVVKCGIRHCCGSVPAIDVLKHAV